MFAAKVKGPDVRKSLEEILEGTDQIEKDRFIDRFTHFADEAMNKWNLCCLFYSMDQEDGQDDIIMFETLVSLVSKEKKLPTPIKTEPVKPAKTEPVKPAVKPEASQ